jgi:hypothetical protein
MLSTLALKTIVKARKKPANALDESRSQRLESGARRINQQSQTMSVPRYLYTHNRQAGRLRIGQGETLLVNAILISENRSPFSEKHYNMYSFVG